MSTSSSSSGSSASNPYGTDNASNPYGTDNASTPDGTDNASNPDGADLCSSSTPEDPRDDDSRLIVVLSPPMGNRWWCVVGWQNVLCLWGR